jgi:DUF438 domain-containing protein
MWDPAGELTPQQLELVLRSMPVGFALADENDVIRYWAGPGFETCDPAFIGRPMLEWHPEHSRAGVRALLEDFRSGARDVVDSVQGAERIIYTALRDEDGTYRGALETVVPLRDEG